MAANTWTAYFPGVSFNNDTILCGVINNSSSKVVKIRRVRFLNAQATAVAGMVCFGEFRRYTSATWSSYSAVSPFPHDTNNTALSDIYAGTGGTISGTSNVLRNYIWSSDEPAVGGATVDEWETVSSFNIVWELGFGDANLTSLTLNEDEMVCIYNMSGSTGTVDIWITFTEA